jgi:hypothetical protein
MHLVGSSRKPHFGFRNGASSSFGSWDPPRELARGIGSGPHLGFVITLTNFGSEVNKKFIQVDYLE